jgi:hypothetical protein
LAEQGNKVLIFSNFISCVNKIKAELETFLREQDGFDPEIEAAFGGERVLKISQNDEGPNIQNKVAKFKDQDSLSRAMVISAKKGGTGLSLENTASYVIMNDFDWSPSTAKQTEGRAFRINNISGVNTFYMLIEGTPQQSSLDQIFYDYVRNKIEIADQIQKLDHDTQKIILRGLNSAPDKKRLAEILQKWLILKNKEQQQKLN